ncbi:TniQ family protein [Polaromonas sp. AER18D-145]|uniref:TniQ family protein n=1 Tax=Polaromonas sp. AER18D-145 TaxID=1977060 RepID=UPI000BBC7DFD
MKSLTSALLVRTPPIVSATDRESLQSWIFRLAQANGFENCGQLFSNEGIKVPSNVALDVAPERWGLFDCLNHMTLYPHARLAELALAEETLALSNTSSPALARWVLTAAIGDASRGSRYSVCPTCITEDVTCYWRRKWRLSTSTFCARHRTMLLDRCPVCQSAFTLSGTRKTPLNRCSNCECELASTAKLSARFRPAFWRQATPTAAGFSSFPVPLAYSHLWWDGIRVLLHVLTRPQLARRLGRSTLPPALGRVFTRISAQDRTDFDKRSVEDRHELLNFMDWATQDWPTRFVLSMREADISWTQFSSCEIEMPYWLLAVCGFDLNKRRYQVSSGEVRAVSALLACSGVLVSKIALKRVLGIAEAKTLDAQYPARKLGLTETELLLVAETLDLHLRNASSGRDVQAVLLRDACCIAAAAWRCISLRSASTLVLNDGYQLRREWGAASGEAGVRGSTAQLFDRWMALYLNGTRVRFERFGPPQNALFLSRFGKPTAGFGLAARFAALLRSCGIQDWARGARLLVGVA